MRVGAEFGDVAQQDNRGARGFSECEQHREVGVRRDDNQVRLGGVVKDHRVGRGQQPEVGNVRRLVPGVDQSTDQLRREVRVQQEGHAGRAIGTSRSFTIAAAYSSAASTSARSRYG